MSWFDQKKDDEVQELANSMNTNLYISTNGTISTDPRETIAENIRTEGNISGHPTGGNCNQDPENVPTEK